MEYINILSIVVAVSFFLCLACIPLGLLRDSRILFVAVLLFIIFIVSAGIRSRLVFNNIEELGCVYIGSGKKGVPHSSPTKYYKCPNGVIMRGA